MWPVVSGTETLAFVSLSAVCYRVGLSLIWLDLALSCCRVHLPAAENRCLLLCKSISVGDSYQSNIHINARTKMIDVYHFICFIIVLLNDA